MQLHLFLVHREFVLSMITLQPDRDFSGNPLPAFYCVFGDEGSLGVGTGLKPGTLSRIYSIFTS
jgi:hypothetical protein